MTHFIHSRGTLLGVTAPDRCCVLDKKLSGCIPCSNNFPWLETFSGSPFSTVVTFLQIMSFKWYKIRSFEGDFLFPERGNLHRAKSGDFGGYCNTGVVSSAKTSVWKVQCQELSYVQVTFVFAGVALLRIAACIETCPWIFWETLWAAVICSPRTENGGAGQWNCTLNSVGLYGSFYRGRR